jgi:hypothetical protein
MAHVLPARHLLRAKGLADARYFEPLGVDDLAALLCTTDRSVADVCLSSGCRASAPSPRASSAPSASRPTAYRAAHPPAVRGALVPGCVVRAYARPQHRTFREDSAAART